jgi:hypothetical protein
MKIDAAIAIAICGGAVQQAFANDLRGSPVGLASMIDGIHAMMESTHGRHIRRADPLREGASEFSTNS